MHNDNNRSIWVTIENGVDMFLNFGALLMAFVFAVMFKEPGKISLESPSTTFLIFVVVVLQSFVFISLNLYRPIPFVKPYYLLVKIMQTNFAYYVVVEMFAVLFYKGARQDFMVVWMLIGGLLSTAILVFKKNLMIYVFRHFRVRRYNLRKVIIVGDNTATAADFVKQVTNNTQYGIMIVGYVGDKIHEDVGCEKLGSFKELGAILDKYHPDDVIFAIDAYDKRHLIKLVNLCDDRCIKVYFLPVIYGFFKSPRQLSSVGTLPLINIHSTPLDNRLNAFIKRVIDVIGSLLLIILTSPIMLVAAIGVYISSPGPILFKQERVGKLGKPFTMLKFRSMRVNVDSDAAWTTGNDPRKTRFGTFLRKTSIDELPQLFNVLVGSMSLVGPRPEIPKFVEYFRDIIPLYMVKHYVKPGMTGLAQVKGLRGDTSVEDRIHADIEYIENWSLGMDLIILLKTPFKAVNKHERYQAEECEEETSDRGSEEVAEDSPVGEACDLGQTLEETVSEGTESAPKTRGKILYAASTMTHINNFHLEYIEQLRKEGYTVKVMARGEGADYNVPFEKKLFSSANTACRAEIRRIIERENFDCIVLNTALAAFHIRFALPKKQRPRVVNIVHGYLFSENVGRIQSALLLLCEKVVASRTDSIIVMNRADLNIAKKHRLCKGRVYYSRGMGATIPEQKTSPERIRRELLCQDKFVMTFVGELSNRKNQEFLILSLNEIKEHIPSAVLWIAGDGAAKEQLMSLAKKIDLSESVFFLGHVKDACDYMRASDLYVSASSIEGMPFNIMEAMGCGKTVLASRVKGHTDLIEEGKSGFLYKFGSISEFKSKVCAIYDGELSVNADDVVARYKEFANENVFCETYGLLKEAMDENG